MIRKHFQIKKEPPKEISKTSIMIGIVFLALVYISTFLPGTEITNKLQVNLLFVFSLASFTTLLFLPTKFRIFPYPLIYSLLGIIWLSILVALSGGHNSDYFPLFYLILIFGGIYLEKLWEIIFLVIFASLGYASHYLITHVMRDCLRDFIVVRIPVYFAAALIPHYAISTIQKVRTEKETIEKLASDLERKARQMEALFAITKRVSSVLNVRYVLDTIAVSAAVALSADYVLIHLLKNDDTLKIASSFGLSKNSKHFFENFKLGEEIIGWVAKTVRPLDIFNTQKDERFKFYRGDNKISSLLSVPMILGARTIGVITVFTKEPRKFTDEDISFLKALASEAAIATETSTLYEKTKKLTIIDALTSLYNIRKLGEELDSEIARSQRYKHTFSFAMLDIDHFKKYNDTHGHPKGDAVLQKVAELIKKYSRDVDTVFRYGGEEFSIIFPETNKKEARTVAERIRRAVEEFPFKGEETQPQKKITISIGIASYPEDAITKEGLIDKADKALYKAKEAGRNRVVLI